MQRRIALLMTTLLTLLAACSRSYTPNTEATGRDIFLEACAECHKAENKDLPGMIFALSTPKANLAYITYKVHEGSLTMPKFPNIRDTQLQTLSDYVLSHSTITPPTSP